MKLGLPILFLALILSSATVGMVQLPMQAQNAAQAKTPTAQIKEWFKRYDAVRRSAQMNPQERAKADTMLAKGLAIMVPGPDKVESAALFQMLQARDAQAADQLKKMELYPETDQLHRGYYKYFSDAASLFGDYLRVQNNLMTPDPATGKPLMGQLLNRKKALEDTDASNKELDAELRSRYGIPEYHY